MTGSQLHAAWTCCVEQGHYGHKCRKATWLLAAGVELPSLAWGRAEATHRISKGPGPTCPKRICVRRNGP